jgi:hypothetical protein
VAHDIFAILVIGSIDEQRELGDGTPACRAESGDGVREQTLLQLIGFQVAVGAGVQVEGVCGQPERAPSPGEHGGASGFPGGEEEDDMDEQIVGKYGETIGGGHRVVRERV